MIAGPGGEVWDQCPRGFFKRQYGQLMGEGFTLKVAFENEFFLLQKSDKGTLIPADDTVFCATGSMNQHHALINDLADAVGINPISVRHHIIKLEAQGLVTSEEERNGVGRPPKVYFLTEEGREKFPTRYLLLTNRLLRKLKTTLPDDKVDELFTQIAEEVVAEYADEAQMAELPMEDRLDILKELLTKEGFTVEWEKDGDYREAVDRSHGSIGRAMYYTSAAITIGFSILVLSDFIPTIHFGLLSAFAMIAALLANFTLLPHLLQRFRPYGVRA